MTTISGAAAEDYQSPELPTNFSALRDAAQDGSLTLTEKMTIREALQTRQDGATAAILKLLAKADSEGLYILGRALFDEDLLRLCYIDGLVAQSWFSSSLISAFVSIARQESPMDTLVDLHTDVWFEQEEEVVDEALKKASESKDFPPTMPILGWPFADLRTAHSRIIGIVNPSGSHWITYEVEFGLRIKVTRYDSAPVDTARGVTFRAITRILPKLLQLASLRPDSPLATPRLTTIDQVKADCIRQCDLNIDCGPLSVFFMICRLSNLSVGAKQLLDTHEQRHAVAQKVRNCLPQILADFAVNTVPEKNMLEHLTVTQHVTGTRVMSHSQFPLATPATLVTDTHANGPAGALREYTDGPGQIIDRETTTDDTSPVASYTAARHVLTSLLTPSGLHPSISMPLATAGATAIKQQGFVELNPLNKDKGTVIVFVRWSSTRTKRNSTVMNDLLRTVVLPRIQSTLNTLGTQESHVIVFGWDQTPTWCMPLWIPSPGKFSPEPLANTSASFPVVQERRIDPPRLHCPLCTWTSHTKSFLVPRTLYRHVATRHMILEQEQSTDIQYKCAEPDCSYTSTKQDRKSALHCFSHANNADPQIDCFCGQCSTPWKLSQMDLFSQHFKGLATNVLDTFTSQELYSLYRSRNATQTLSEALHNADTEAMHNRWPTPILLIFGLDGLTCHTMLLKIWLQQIREVRFKLAIQTSDIPPGLRPVSSDWLQSGGEHVAILDREALLRALVGSTDNLFLSQLVEHWSDMQGTKDGLTNRVFRNRNKQ